MKRCASLAALLLASCAWAQEAASQPSEIKAIQDKSTLTDEDRGALRRWIEKRTDDVVNGSTGAAEELRDAYRGSGAFKEAFAGLTVDAVSNAYKTAKPAPATQLIAVLSTLNEVPAYKIFTEGLADQRIGVRTAAAVGLRNLRSKLLLPAGNYVPEALTALRDAAKNESSAVALKTMYQAMNFLEQGMNPPEPKAVAAAIVDVLEARAQLHAGGDTRGEAAEATGLEIAAAMRPAMSDADRDRLGPIAGRLLGYGVFRYTSELHRVRDKAASNFAVEVRNSIEQLIDVAERILVDQLKPKTPPNLAKGMREDVQGDKETNMKNHMNEWARLLEEKYPGQKFVVEENAGG